MPMSYISMVVKEQTELAIVTEAGTVIVHVLAPDEHGLPITLVTAKRNAIYDDDNGNSELAVYAQSQDSSAELQLTIGAKSEPVHEAPFYIEWMSNTDHNVIPHDPNNWIRLRQPDLPYPVIKFTTCKAAELRASHLSITYLHAYLRVVDANGTQVGEEYHGVPF